jgi:hypothetical protein
VVLEMVCSNRLHKYNLEPSKGSLGGLGIAYGEVKISLVLVLSRGCWIAIHRRTFVSCFCFSVCLVRKRLALSSIFVL